MSQPSLGGQELEVWRYIADHAPAPTRQVIEHFAAERGLARTTVLTVLERLRKKGYLSRVRQEGVYHYSPRVPPGEVLQGLVRQFIEKTLAGSVSPLVAYLARTKQLSDDEIADLQRLLEELKTGREREEP
jgi:predicted transcriptional regulator